MCNKNKRRTPLKAIRTKCLDCSCWQPKEVRLCAHIDCSLYPYRFGKNPARAGMGNKTGGFSQKPQAQQEISEEKSEANTHIEGGESYETGTGKGDMSEL